ncbi:calcium-binding protein [Shinella kummerowiae]|uniref:calcium-binding protein n=1 Tax=Shinella kummerowiae TaxID=417745 RepID=UPI0021B538AB|nr:calcium-binding protein [Shinella kummerowiae]MCT7666329.1 calcium-binding protein [Shinella kummerowiae]
MKLFDQVKGQSPEFTLTRNGTVVEVLLNYDLSGWYDEEAGFYVYEGEALISVGDTYNSVYQSHGGDRPLYMNFTASLTSGVTYQNEYTVTDWGDGTDVKFTFNTTLFSVKAEFTGTEAVDVVFGSVAGDVLSGGGGNDFIEGHTGHDVLDGGEGKDILYGGMGNDTYIVDDEGDQVIEAAGAGTDVVESSFSYYNLGANIEALTLTGSSSINGHGNSGANVITGNVANNYLDGDAGADTLIGGKGDDSYRVENAGDVVVENAGEGSDHVRSYITYELAANIEKLTLDSGQPVNGFGNTLDNYIWGSSSANVLDGDAGNDNLYGDAGNDILLGGDGDDYLTGGSGTDRLYGGSGSDKYLVDAFDRVIEAAGGGNDRVSCSASFTLAAGAEVEALATSQSNGEIAINLTGNEFAQTVTGNDGNNVLSGAGGNDTLKGGGGADKLLGGLGSDKLYGGSGADTFVFQTYQDNTLSVRDMIYDFSRQEGDRIDLSAIDANTKVAGNQAFTFIGEKAFSNKAGELRYVNANGDTYIHGDGDGDGTIDFSARLDTTIEFVKGDFIL